MGPDSELDQGGHSSDSTARTCGRGGNQGRECHGASEAQKGVAQGGDPEPGCCLVLIGDDEMSSGSGRTEWTP